MEKWRECHSDANVFVPHLMDTVQTYSEQLHDDDSMSIIRLIARAGIFQVYLRFNHATILYDSIFCIEMKLVNYKRPVGLSYRKYWFFFSHNFIIFFSLIHIRTFVGFFLRIWLYFRRDCDKLWRIFSFKIEIYDVPSIKCWLKSFLNRLRNFSHFIGSSLVSIILSGHTDKTADVPFTEFSCVISIRSLQIRAKPFWVHTNSFIMVQIRTVFFKLANI